MLSLKCVCVRACALNTLLVGSECNLEWPNRKWSCRQTELRITNHDSCLLPQGDIQVYLARCVHVCVKFTQRLFLFRNKVLQVPTLHLFSHVFYLTLWWSSSANPLLYHPHIKIGKSGKFTNRPEVNNLVRKHYFCINMGPFTTSSNLPVPLSRAPPPSLL